MKLNKIGLLLGLLLGIFAANMPAKSVRAGCGVACWSRSCASNYGETAVDEPYRLNHAEWENDDVLSWEGEGVDCSGLVNKVWGLKDNSGSTDFFWWYTHESLSQDKYFARNFYRCGEPGYGMTGCYKVCDAGSLTSCPYAYTEEMDAFVTLNNPSSDLDDHIGLIYEELADGNDQILEAVDREGSYQDVHIIIDDWRKQTKYRGIRRLGWSNTCWPSCPNCKSIFVPSIYRGQPTPYRGSEYPSPSPIPGPVNPYP